MADPYPDLLARLDPAGFLLPPVGRRLCLLTGQSSFTTSALPDDKRAFLTMVAPAGAEVTMTGFPWHAAVSDERAPPGLLAASLRNASQWLWARRHEGFRAALSAILGLALARTEERLLLVTGSCGVDLLAQALSRLPSHGPELWVASLGPVGRLPPDRRIARSLIIQGRGDSWSRLLWRGRVHRRPDCGHLDYYRNRETIAATAAFFGGASP